MALRIVGAYLGNSLSKVEAVRRMLGPENSLSRELSFYLGHRRLVNSRFNQQAEIAGRK